MRYCRIKFIITLFLLYFSACFVFARNETLKTELFFWDGNNENLSLHITGVNPGSSYDFDVKIKNLSTSPVSVNMGFVDGTTTNDVYKNKACLPEGYDQKVGQYISGQKSFSIAPKTFVIKTYTLYLPLSYSYSGYMQACVTHYPFSDGDSGVFSMSARRGNFLDVYVNLQTQEFDLIVRPAFRPNNTSHNIGYSIKGADFWFFIYENGSWQSLYNSAKNQGAKINTDKNGLAKVYFLSPVSGTQYLLAFKGNGTLSIGYTGIRKDGITGFNLFSGVLVNKLNSDFVLKYHNDSFTGAYLKVGDVVANTSGTYDTIRDQDFALMTNHLTTSSYLSHPYWFDLDLNGIINALEQNMILDSYNSRGFIVGQEYIDLDHFLSF